MSSSPRRDEVQAFVLELARKHGAPRPRPEDRLTDLGIDSITLSDQLGALERRFRVRMDADVADVDTVAELVDYVASRRR